MVKMLWNTVWQLLKKLNIELPYDPEIPLLDSCPTEMKTSAQFSRSVVSVCPHKNMYINDISSSIYHSQKNGNHLCPSADKEKTKCGLSAQ